MERRELLKMIALLTGGAVIGGDVFLSGCKTAPKQSGLLSAKDISTADAVANVIIPDTDTPGAKAAKVGEFMNVFVNDCYTPAEQKAFVNGLKTLNDYCQKEFDKNFADLDAKQQNTVISKLEAEAKPFNEGIAQKEKAHREDARASMKEFVGEPRHYYTMLKQLTILGYFTSEIGMTKALRLLPVPGRYDGEFPYKKGDRAWAT